MTRKEKTYIVVDVDTGRTTKVKGNFNLSPNVQAWELSSDDEIELILYSTNLLARFEQIRSIYKRPIRITSGHRSLNVNEKVGGYVDSHHLYGKALDMNPPKGVSVDDFARTCEKVLGYNSGVGRYANHVHIDIVKHFRKDWR